MEMPENKKTNHVSILKQALSKKHAAQHPDAQGTDKDIKGLPGRTTAVANKPQKKVTGRGR